jgi:hypothetical protein
MRIWLVLFAAGVLAAAGVTQAADLYSTDFENPFTLGTINGQDNWTVGSGDGTSLDGMIVDDGTGNQVLQITAATGGWGDEVKRDYNSPSTLRYLVVEMDFQMKDGPSFYFNDQNGTVAAGGPESIFWDEDPDHIVKSNAGPGITPMPITYDTWYHIGIQVDQQSKEIITVNYNGVWLNDNDTPDTAEQMTRFIYRSYGYVADESKRLWIDNLSITDSDTAIPPIPEPATVTLFGLGLAGWLGLRRRRRK